MPTIVFACKSNSCRSQMAEGWARNWLQKRKDDVDIKLQSLHQGKINDCDEDDMKKQLSLLENTTIASVALDASAVFESSMVASSSSSSVTTAGTVADAGAVAGAGARRKNIKSKAIQAMADDGVDIASYIPKTLDEVLPFINNHNHLGIHNQHKHQNQHQNQHQHQHHITEHGVQIGSSSELIPSSPKNISKTNHQYSNNHHHTINNNNNNINNDNNQPLPLPLVSPYKEQQEHINNNNNNNINNNNMKPVDKLIVLCSCGDELKHKIARRSKSVEEWSIDPPTTAAKNGEGDAAYRRVSLEVKNEVNILMQSLIGDVLD